MNFIELNDFFRKLWPPPADPFERVAELAGEEFRRVKTRRTFRVEIEGKGFFVKHHLGVGWGEIFKNWLMFKAPVVSALNEFNALKRLHELGVPTMTAAACGCRGENPAKLESFLITEELADMADLEGLATLWQRVPPTLEVRRGLLRAVADSVRKMHEGGVNHRDCYLCHFLTPRDEKRFGKEVYVIDLHRAQLRRRVPRRYLVKDLAGLCFSSFDAGLSKRDVLRFIRLYTGRPLRKELKERAGFWQDVLETARKLYLKECLRPAPEFA